MDDTEHIQPRLTYLGAAIHAKDFVEKKMDIGSSNKFPNSYYGFPSRYGCVQESRGEIGKDLAKQAPDIRRDGINPLRAMVNTWAYWAQHYGCGNCGEQSALAFVHLRDIYKLFPLDWMQVGNFRHGFVVLGRIGVTEPSKTSTWNDEAVICDPWRGEALAAADATYLKSESPGLIYRMADASAW